VRKDNILSNTYGSFPQWSKVEANFPKSGENDGEKKKPFGTIKAIISTTKVL